MRANILLVLLLVVGALFVEGQSASAKRRQEKRLMDCTLESTSFDDCNIVGYLTRVAVFSAPGLIIAIFMLLACPFYCGAKYCCNCCGGRRQTPNYCCPNNDLPARYSKGDLVRPKVFSLILILTTIGALIWGIVGAVMLSGGLGDFGTSIKGVPKIIGVEIDALDRALTVRTYSAATDSESTVSLFNTTGADLKTQAVKVQVDLQEQVDSSMGDYQGYIDKFKIALFLIFAVPVFFITIGFIAAIANLRNYLPMCLVWFLFLFGFVVWIVHVIFCLTSFVVGDVCAEVDGLANKQLNLVGTLLQCKDSQFAEFKNTFKNLDITESERTCNGIRTLCFDNSATQLENVASGRVFSCPASLTCTGLNFARLLILVETAFQIHSSLVNFPPAIAQGQVCVTPENVNSCFISKCASDCTLNASLSATGKASKEIYFNFLVARTVSNTIDTLGARFSTCDSVMSLIASPFNPPCKRVVSGLVIERQSSGLMGLCTIAGIFIIAWGAKRFISLDQADVPQGIDDDKNKSGKDKDLEGKNA